MHFIIDAHRVLAEGAVDKDEAATVKSGEGVARVAAKIPVKPGEKLTFAVDCQDMQFFDIDLPVLRRSEVHRVLAAAAAAGFVSDVSGA